VPKQNAEQQIREKIRDMMERHNIKVVRIPWWETLWYRHVAPLISNIKYYVQEHVRGYSDLDCWNVAWYIARKSVPPLQKMRDGFMGTPVRRHVENRHGEIIELKNVVYGNEADILNEQQWRDVLDDMIFAFEWPLRQDNPDFDHENSQYVTDGCKRQKRGLILFSIYYNDLWD